jgi:hypothetical protein
MINVLNKQEIEGTCLNIIKTAYNKPAANITLRGQTKAISSKVRNEERVSTLCTIVLEFLEQ